MKRVTPILSLELKINTSFEILVKTKSFHPTGDTLIIERSMGFSCLTKCCIDMFENESSPSFLFFFFFWLLEKETIA